jgi:hypothetical protein
MRWSALSMGVLCFALAFWLPRTSSTHQPLVAGQVYYLSLPPPL